MTNATDALRPPFMQRCYTCGRESPAGPLLHFIGCAVGAGTGSRLDAVGTNGCKAALATPAGSASGEDGDGVANCAECGAFLEHVRPGKHQHLTCSHVASALQAEVARHKEYAADAAAAKLEAELAQRRTEAEAAVLREALLTIRDSTFRSALQLRGIADRALTAAMGSANGQG